MSETKIDNLQAAKDRNRKVPLRTQTAHPKDDNGVTFLQVGFERLGGVATTANGNRFDKYVQQVLGYSGVQDMKLPHRVLFNYMPSVIMY